MCFCVSCAPVIRPFCPSQVVGVAQAINKKCGEDGAFTDQDEKVCEGLDRVFELKKKKKCHRKRCF